MVELNCTLIIQAFNFLIAYTMLRVLLFKPALASINQETAYTRGLLTGIEASKACIAKKELDAEQQWYTFKEHARKHIPVEEYNPRNDGISIPPIHYPLLPEATVKELTNALAHSLIEKVADARR